MFSLESFINKFVTKRPSSMFYPDIESNKDALTKKIQGKSVLVIGGAGSIGSSFIKAILPYKPASLVVVDTYRTHERFKIYKRHVCSGRLCYISDGF